MFPVKHADPDPLSRVAAWAGIDLTTDQRVKLERYGAWLRDEAVSAGGIGPGEGPRVIDRHVADALTFAVAWEEPLRSALDVGSGVGLPGIPLAITHPATWFILLDRSGRRCGLARRAVRILNLPNVEVVQGDVESTPGTWSAVLFRAALGPDVALAVAAPRMEPDGCAVVGLSRRPEPPTVPAAPPDMALDLFRTDPGVLDSPAWVLRMTRTEPRSKDGNPS